MKKSVFYLALIWGLLTSNAMAEQSDVTAYYFHSNVRCSTCRNIERMTKEAIATITFEKYARKFTGLLFIGIGSYYLWRIF